MNRSAAKYLNLGAPHVAIPRPLLNVPDFDWDGRIYGPFRDLQTVVSDAFTHSHEE
jgi:hypothetical protein